MLAFPEMFRAPPAVGSSTMIDWPIVIVLAVVLLVRKFVSPEYVTVIEWLTRGKCGRDERSHAARQRDLAQVDSGRRVEEVDSAGRCAGAGCVRGNRRRDGNCLAHRAAGVEVVAVVVVAS